jgi:hypothetical protein
MNWQPIETAPKNPEGKFWGPTILVFCSADNFPWPAYWGQCNKTGDATEGTWFCADGVGDDEFDSRDVTHWMPLPNPPEAT